MKKAELKIKGMHCKSCVMLVKEALTDIKGVSEASVDLEKGKASVSYDEKLVKEKQLTDAIEKEGYKVVK
ncbi:MAG: heavy-metal-associated domain-containing protein [Candidatus Woesearchaeota archaeon]